jgi:hypothetical protein
MTRIPANTVLSKTRKDNYPTFWEFMAMMESFYSRTAGSCDVMFDMAVSTTCSRMGIKMPFEVKSEDIQSQILYLGSLWGWWETQNKVSNPQFQSQAGQQIQPQVTYVSVEDLSNRPHTSFLEGMARSRQNILGIKYIREVTGLSLKEAKDYWDRVWGPAVAEAHKRYCDLSGVSPNSYTMSLAEKINTELKKFEWNGRVYDHIKNRIEAIIRYYQQEIY